jgi:hypothetical protein
MNYNLHQVDLLVMKTGEKNRLEIEGNSEISCIFNYIIKCSLFDGFGNHLLTKAFALIFR